MLYLEDYLEMIENLPMEMRERFTDMREADLESVNMVDTLDDKVAHFFKRCVQSSVKKEWRDEQFNKLKEEYIKAIEHSNEKISIANQVYDVVDRHVRKLDTELSKFKMELEADHAGITELLEKRSLELDNVPKENNPPPKRKYTAQYNVPEKKYKYEVHTTVVHSPVESPDVYHTANPYTQPPQQSTSSNQYNIVGTSAQANPALRAAASQAIAATQQNMHAGRRSTSLKASIELTKAHDPWTRIDSSASSALNDQSQTSRSQRVKKLSHKAEELMKSQQAKKHVSTGQKELEVKSPISTDIPTVIDDGQASGEWNYDPSEPRYCVCNQVSYGEMIGCDNNDCPLEWFHYGCVGLTSAPKGKWYCPQCRANMKGRKGRN